MPRLKKTVDTLGRECGFICRQRKLTASHFLAVMTFGHVGMKLPSLGGMVDAVELPLSREAFHKRFTGAAVTFLRVCLLVIMKSKLGKRGCLDSAFLRHFKRFIFFDSSSWDVNNGLRELFPGSGGNASQANCKLQMGYDFKGGTFMLFDLTPGIQPDNNYTHSLPDYVKRGDLIIIDLGYFCTQTLRSIVDKEAYFVSRLSVGVTLFDVNYNEIDLTKRLSKCTKQLTELPIIIGSGPEKQLSCRLICIRVPEEIAQKRRRRLIKAAQKKGRTPSAKHLKLAAWTLMITNVEETILPAHLVRTLYSLRWQIELLFKQFKSVLNIHHSNVRTNQERLQCEIYGKLIVAVVIAKIHADIHSFLWNNAERELSFDKFSKRIQERSFLIFKMLLISREVMAQYLMEEIGILIPNCMKCQQKQRQTTLAKVTILYRNWLMGEYSDA